VRGRCESLGASQCIQTIGVEEVREACEALLDRRETFLPRERIP
jgi:hypothetical protein